MILCGGKWNDCEESAAITRLSDALTLADHDKRGHVYVLYSKLVSK